MLKTFRQHLSILRPHHWLKNVLLFFPPFFGGKILDPSVYPLMIPSFLSFSFAASCCYILNDIADRDFDRHHASKKHRAIAGGTVSPTGAFIMAAVLYIQAMLISVSVSARFEACLILYIFLTISYTIYFKNIVIVDLFFIAFGFLIRVMAGGEAFNVKISSWLYLTVFIVALFLAAGKRLGERITHGEESGKHRENLNQYTESFLEGILWSSAASALVMYSFYVIEKQERMMYTVPVVAFGLLRYIYLAKKGNGEPTAVLIGDSQILGAGALWMALIGFLIY